MDETTKNATRRVLQRLGVLALIRRARAGIRRGMLRAFRSVHAPQAPVGGPLLVNLGCGVHSGAGYTNVDIQQLPNIHHIHDIRDLPMFSDGSVDLLYACHVVEHIPRHELLRVMREWARVLRIGGVFRFSVPDFDALLEVYQASGGRVDSIVDQLMGQRPPYDSHYSIWNEQYARELLAEVGFVNVRRWDPVTAPYHTFRDKSSRVMNAAGREVPISLNLEADRA